MIDFELTADDGMVLQRSRRGPMEVTLGPVHPEQPAAFPADAHPASDPLLSRRRGFIIRTADGGTCSEMTITHGEATVPVDRFEGARGNDTTATATAFDLGGTARLGDLTLHVPRDRDVYWLVLPSNVRPEVLLPVCQAAAPSGARCRFVRDRLRIEVVEKRYDTGLREDLRQANGERVDLFRATQTCAPERTLVQCLGTDTIFLEVRSESGRPNHYLLAIDYTPPRVERRPSPEMAGPRILPGPILDPRQPRPAQPPPPRP